MVSPSTNSSEVSSQSTLPSFRATKPSRLAAMWIVTRESAFAIVPPSRYTTTPPNAAAQRSRAAPATLLGTPHCTRQALHYHQVENDGPITKAQASIVACANPFGRREEHNEVDNDEYTGPRNRLPLKWTYPKRSERPLLPEHDNSDHNHAQEPQRSLSQDARGRGLWVSKESRDRAYKKCGATPCNDEARDRRSSSPCHAVDCA